MPEPTTTTPQEFMLTATPESNQAALVTAPRNEPVKPVVVAPEAPATWDPYKAAFRRLNSVGAVTQYFSHISPEASDKTFNAPAYIMANKEEFKDLLGYYARGEFDYVHSEAQLHQRASLIRAQLADEEMLRKGGSVIPSLVMGLADPMNLLGILPMTSASRLGNAGRLAASFAGQAAITESVIRSVNPTVDTKESAMNVLMAGALGGAVGGLFKGVPAEYLNPGNPKHLLAPENIAKNDGMTVADVGGAHVGIGPDSVGAARVATDDFKKGRSNSKVANALMDGLDALMDHGSPVARLFKYPSEVGRRLLGGTVDIGNRFTQAEMEGFARLNAESIMNTEGQYLRGIADEIQTAHRNANADMGQGGLRTAAGGLVEAASLGKVAPNAVSRKVFDQLLFVQQAAKKVGDTTGPQRVLALLKEQGYSDEIAAAIGRRVEEAGQGIDRFHNRYLDRQLEAGVIDDAQHAEFKGQGYGLSTLYRADTIFDNAGLMKSMLMKKLAGNPSDDFLRKYAEGRLKFPEGEAVSAEMREQALKAEVDSIKADRFKLDAARAEWVGDMETANVIAAEAKHADLVRKAEEANDLLMQVMSAERDFAKARKVADYKQLKAEVRVMEANYFRRALGFHLDKVEKAKADLADAELRVTELSKLRDELITQKLPAGANEVERLTAALDGKSETKAIVGNSAQSAGGEVRANTKHNNAEELARAQERLERTKAEYQAASDAFKAARAELSKAAALQKSKESLLRKLDESIDNDLNSIARVPEEAGVRASLEVERLRIEQVTSKLEQARAVRAEARESLKAVQTARRALGSDADRAARRAARAEKAAKNLGAAVPLESYVDDLVHRMSGGGRAPDAGFLTETIGDSARLKEVKIEWTLDELLELGKRNLVVSDINENLAKYHRETAGRVALKESIGTWDPVEANRLIGDDYNEMIEKALAAGDNKTADRLAAYSRQHQADQTLMMQKVMGRAQIGSEGEASAIWYADKLKGVTFLASAPGFVFSAMADISTAMLATSGFLKSLVNGTLKETRMILKAAKSGERWAEEAGAFLGSLEHTARLKASGDFLGQVSNDAIANGGIKGAIDQLFSVAGEQVGKFSGLTQLSDTIRRTGSMATMQLLLKDAKKINDALAAAKKADKADAALRDVDIKALIGQDRLVNYASMGLGLKELERIGAAHAQHGSAVKDFNYPAFYAWDKDLREKTVRALTTAGRRSSYVPGYGMTPNFMVKWWGSLLMQFQSYAFTFTHNFVMGGTQKLLAAGDSNAVAALGASIALAAINSQMKAWIRGEDTDNWDQRKWAMEIVSRGGYMGYMSPYFDSAVKFADPSGTLLGQQSKFRNNNAFESLLGPNVGTLNRGVKVLNAVRDGDTEALMKTGALLIPFHQQAALLQALDEHFLN